MKKTDQRVKRIVTVCAAAAALAAAALDHPQATTDRLAPDRFTLVSGGRPQCRLVVDAAENSAVRLAARNLAADFRRVTGADVPETGDQVILAGTVDGPTLKPLIDAGRLDVAALRGRREQYRITFVRNPCAGVREALVVAGSDRRGAVYGLYELSEQIGVSPWYDWADAPLRWKAKDGRKLELSIARGDYTNGEPAVRYRGIFLNDEAPCLTGWVKSTYGTDVGDHRFYARVGELILRLRGNFLWPAMWCWAFYADDPANSATLDAMGVIVGTSHHEPMGRNHQEYARDRKGYGPWNYRTNKASLDDFFAAGVRRLKDTEDVVTIGMRGDGDEEMDEAGNLDLMRTIIDSQRAIIARETGRPAAATPQVWALYKEVQADYDRGLRPPDDVTILLCDDNWGNVRRLPNAAERGRPGGWGMYYHVDYVGAPRNSKFINCTSAISLWEQMSLAYEYGVDRLWILNVGDLKPMEYPITLFLDMAWRPTRYTPQTLHAFTESFCADTFALGRADCPQSAAEIKEAARILDASARLAARCTPELLNKDTYDLASGEWATAAGDYARLAAAAKKQYDRLDAAAKDAYFEIVLFPAAVMANLYDLYFAQAMNASLAARGDAAANAWADRMDTAFARHAELCRRYNEDVAGGKWNGMMRQKVIGYTSWSDGFPADTCPPKLRVENGEVKVEDDHSQSPALNSPLAQSEPRIYSVARNQSYDKDMGENWWMRRHEATLAAIAREKVFDLVLVGDSITHRWERHGRAAYGGVTNGLKVLNIGFGADNVKNLLWRLRSGELDGYRAKVVQLMIGTNNGPHEPAAETAAQIRACLREIRARQPSAKILLCPILPRGTPDCVERGKNDEVNRLLRPLADGQTILWTDYADVFLLADGRFDPALTDDNLHPNAAGYAKWAPVVRAAYEAAVAARPRPAAPRPPVPPPAPAAARAYTAIEAPHYASAVAPAGFRWATLPGLGRTLGAVEVFPRLDPPTGAKLIYRAPVPADASAVTVTVVTRSTLAFARAEGHRYTVTVGGTTREVNFNARLNEDPANRYSVFYPTVARRVVAEKVRFDRLPARDGDGRLTVELAPLDPGVAFEKIVVAWGEGPAGYLFGTEAAAARLAR